MSREPKDKNPVPPKQPRFNDVQFVNWSLTEEHKAACKIWLKTLEDVEEALHSTIEAGYKVTLSYDTYRSCYTASIVPTKDAKSNQGFILTGKGSTPLKAAKQAMYIHYLVMDEEWANYSNQAKVEELDD